MPVISIAGNKGGAGKTTLSINLACAFAQQGSTVLLDADPQQSAYQWSCLSSIDDNFPILVNASTGVSQCVDEYQSDYDYVVIDCPPSVHSEQTQQAFMRSDLVVLPVLPSPFDLWASVKVADQIEQVRANNASLQALLVINQLEPRTKLSQAIRKAIAELDIPVAETAICRRMIYRSSILEGRSVLHEGARATDAKNELKQLVNEIGAIL